MSAKVCVTRFKENRAAFLVLTPMEDCVRWVARIKIWRLKFGGEPQLPDATTSSLRYSMLEMAHQARLNCYGDFF